MPASRSDAFVTLVASEAYTSGALVVASALRKYGTLASVACLVTQQVSEPARLALQEAFDYVHLVEEVESTDQDALQSIGRPELALSLTKLHVFDLVQYRSIVYLDADTLPLRNIDELFDLTIYHAFSASPDSGWPDAFNSGVFIAKPSSSLYARLRQMLGEHGSWDGGDQGILNDAFPSWNRISFAYNCTPSNLYMYAPAYRRYGRAVAIVHFVGSTKPWLQVAQSWDGSSSHYDDFLRQWHDLHEEARHHYRPSPVQVSAAADTAIVREQKETTIVEETPSQEVEQEVVRTWSPPRIEWDPARHAPPLQGHQAGLFQPESFLNKWDAPDDRSERAFDEMELAQRQIPQSALPYLSIDDSLSDVSDLKPIFPWENRSRRSTRSFPEDALRPQRSQVPASQGQARGKDPAAQLHKGRPSSFVEAIRNVPESRLPTVHVAQTNAGSLPDEPSESPEEDRESRYGDDEEEDSETGSSIESQPISDHQVRDAKALEAPVLGLSSPSITLTTSAESLSAKGYHEQHQDLSKELGISLGSSGSRGTSPADSSKMNASGTTLYPKRTSPPRLAGIPMAREGSANRNIMRDLSPNAQMKAAMKDRLIRPEGSGRVWDPARSLMKLKAENELGQKRILNNSHTV